MKPEVAALLALHQANDALRSAVEKLDALGFREAAIAARAAGTLSADAVGKLVVEAAKASGRPLVDVVAEVTS